MKTIGILGGMGPSATNRLCALITQRTSADTDQTHVPVICYNNSAIPSRVDAIFSGGISPLPELIRTARVLQSAGADFLLMPCNTAHYYLQALRASINIPLLDMIEETAKYIASVYPPVKVVGILASTPTLRCGLFHNSLGRFGVSVVTPDAAAQEHLVMESIFGEWGIKAGFLDHSIQGLETATKQLIDQGAELVVAGCTELSLVLPSEILGTSIVDPLEVIAEVAVRHSMSEGAEIKPREPSLCVN